MRSLSIGFIQDSLINCDFHPWGSWCSKMGLSRSVAAVPAAHATRRRQRESAGCVTTSCPPPQIEHEWLSLAFTLEESQKGNSHPTSLPVSHSEEMLSLIVKTSECEGSDSQPMYHADISGHSAELGLCVTSFKKLYSLITSKKKFYRTLRSSALRLSLLMKYSTTDALAVASAVCYSCKIYFSKQSPFIFCSPKQQWWGISVQTSVQLY